MMETVSGHQPTAPSGGTAKGHGKMFLLWLVPFILFAGLAIYSLANKKLLPALLPIKPPSPLCLSLR
jgi:hypothetical protein